ncbi:MAG: outer membrane lipoprotein carrier protein LolA [Nitrospiraceae bacterium]|nr:MAG: outer membrane lipoprotein carrier protein LolA [Nitrospiraceae bacterium]
MEKEPMRKKSKVKSQKSKVKKIFLFLLFLLFTINCSLIPSVYAATVEEIVKDIQSRLSDINDIKGTFTQTSYLKDLEKTETYSGTFYIKKPSGIMWEYNTPRDEKVIINGTDTWIYRESQKQAIRTKLSKESYSQVPIALLNSLGNLSVEFNIMLEAHDVLNLRPKQKMGFMQEIILKTVPENFPIKTLKVLDTYGNLITIEIRDIKTNLGLKDSLFTFTPPQGVEVYDMSQ